MAQEVSTLETGNAAGGFLSGLASLVTAAAPVAANAYQLKLQSDVLKNASSGTLAALQLQQQAAAKTATGTATASAWMPYAMAADVVGLVILLILRRRR